METQLDKLPKTIMKGDNIAGLTISYKHFIKKWVISYGRLTAKNVYYDENINKAGIGDTIAEAYVDFIKKIKNYKVELSIYG